MIATDEEALICDLAETYHILNYRELPCRMVALFSAGLRKNSRIKMKMCGKKYPLETELLALIVDHLSAYIWAQNKGHKTQRPVSIYEQLQESRDKQKNVEAFDSPEDFEMRKKEILKKGGV